MACKRLALLIACPYGGLLGPDNDVELMGGVLEKYGFESTKCCGPNATRKGILDAWQHLNSELSADDVAVIYYSGHGGIVESSRDTHDQENEKGGDEGEGEGEGELGEPLRSQFLVPMDFNLTTENDFRGILDIEISYMLRDTTNKTENVTVILDCCHAARMARDPSHNNKAWPRNLPEIKHHGVLLSHVNKLRSEGQFKGHNFIEGNPHAVRIAAAATAETAWGYENWQRKPIGILTEALAEALDKAVGQKLSWRTILMGVCEFVKREFPQQHPRAEGPDTRLLFSKEHMASGALMIQIRRGYGIIQGGTVAGIHEGNIYDVMPFGFEVVETAERAAEVKVKYVNGFQALAEVTSGRIPIEGGIAFLRQEAVARVQVSFPDDLFPDDLPALEARLEQSRFLKRCTLDTQSPMVNIKREGECLLVCKGDMVLSSHPFTDATMHTAMDAVVRDGERLARAHHVLSLESGKEDEKLNHATEIEFGLVDDARCMKKIKQDGMATVIEDQRAYIKIHNGGYSTIFVSVFDVNVAGKVTLVSKGSSKGIELRPNDAYVLGKEQFGRLRGLKLSWPQGVSKEVQIEETLVFVISSEEVSLQHLADPSRNIEARGRVSSLEKITYHLVSGQARDMETEPEGRYIRYAVHHIPFSLHPERAQRFE